MVPDDNGVAIGCAIVGSSKPVAGDHKNVIPLPGIPGVPIRVPVPSQISRSGPAFAWYTVTTACSFLTQPIASVTCKVYTEEVAGVETGYCTSSSSNPTFGVHK